THENFCLVNDPRTFQKPFSFTTSNEWYTGAWANGDRARECPASSSTYLYGTHTDAPIFFASVLKLHHAINQGKKRVVPPDTDIKPRFERRPTLPHQNAPSAHCLPGKALHPKAFADAVASIGGAALS